MRSTWPAPGRCTRSTSRRCRSACTTTSTGRIPDETRRHESSMILTDAERAMLDGRDGKARQKAMELLVRYAQALGAERFVETNNVAGVPGSYTPFLFNYYKATRENAYDLVYSLFDLDSDEVVDVPRMTVHSCHLQGGVDRSE